MLGFAVPVKMDCPHVAMVSVQPMDTDEAREVLSGKCASCGMLRCIPAVRRVLLV
jgi:hypothetical protein